MYGIFSKCAVPENIHTPLMECFFFFAPLPTPPRKFQFLIQYFASKIVTFKTPLPLGISNDLP